MYNKNNFDFNYSFSHEWETKPNDVVFFWDTHSFLQNSLILNGYKMLCLGEKNYFDGIHYWGSQGIQKLMKKMLRFTDI